VITAASNKRALPDVTPMKYRPVDGARRPFRRSLGLLQSAANTNEADGPRASQIAFTVSPVDCSFIAPESV